MEPYLWWYVVVKARLCSGDLRWPFLCAMVERAKLFPRGRPALPRCTDSESGDKMIDRVSIPVRLRSLGL